MTREKGVRLRMVREVVRDRASGLDRGDRVLEHELIRALDLDHDRELVEVLDAGVELPAVHQVDGHRHAIAPRVVQEGVLNVGLSRGRGAWFRYLGHQGASPRVRTPREASRLSTR